MPQWLVYTLWGVGIVVVLLLITAGALFIKKISSEKSRKRSTPTQAASAPSNPPSPAAATGTATVLVTKKTKKEKAKEKKPGTKKFNVPSWVKVVLGVVVAVLVVTLVGSALSSGHESARKQSEAYKEMARAYQQQTRHPLASAPKDEEVTLTEEPSLPKFVPEGYMATIDRIGPKEFGYELRSDKDEKLTAEKNRSGKLTIKKGPKAFVLRLTEKAEGAKVKITFRSY